MTSILRTLFAYASACLVAALVIVAFANPPTQLLALPADDRVNELGSNGMLILETATHSAIFAAPFALITILFGVFLKTRSALFYSIAGTAISLFGLAALRAAELPGQSTILNPGATTGFVLSGLLGGLTYWLLAGRYVRQPAGNDTVKMRKPDRTPPPIVTSKNKHSKTA